MRSADGMGRRRREEGWGESHAAGRAPLSTLCVLHVLAWVYKPFCEVVWQGPGVNPQNQGELVGWSLWEMLLWLLFVLALCIINADHASHHGSALSSLNRGMKLFMFSANVFRYVQCEHFLTSADHKIKYFQLMWTKCVLTHVFSAFSPLSLTGSNVFSSSFLWPSIKFSFLSDPFYSFYPSEFWF